MTSDEIKNSRNEKTSLLLDEFFTLADAWDLSVEEQKKLLGESTLKRVTCETNASPDITLADQTISRLVLVTSIREDLKILFPSPRCDTYIRAKNRAFGGSSLLEVILKSPDKGLPEVKDYLMGTILGGYT